MKLFITTDVIVAYVIKRGKKSSMKRLFSLAKEGKDIEYITYSAVPDSLLVLKKSFNSKEDERYNKKLIDFFKTMTVVQENVEDMRAAQDLGWDDKICALQHILAKSNKCNAIITLNTLEFKNTDIPIMCPEEFLKQYAC